MKAVVTSAKTREDAIEDALRQLGVERHEVHVEILDVGSKGIFGLGARNVQVKVTAENLPDDEPEQERRPPRRGRRSDSDGRGRRERKRPPRDESRGPRQERRERSDQGPSDVQPKEKEEPQEKPQRRESPEPVYEKALSEGEVTEASALLEEVTKLMGIDSKVRAYNTEDNETVLAVDSEDSAILIGRKGRNLQALQYLINRMIQNDESMDVSDRIIVDVEGYLERRKASLEEMALRLADKAKKSERRVRVKPLTAPERRVIHMTLQDDPDIRTFSVGDSAARCVMIAPKNERPRRRSGSRGGPRRGGGRPRGDGNGQSSN